MGISRAYLDSYYLLEMVYRTDSHSDVQKLLYQLKQNTFEVFVSQTVLGEVITKIFQRSASTHTDVLSKLPNVLQDHNINPTNCLTPLPSEALDIMSYIRKHDLYLDMTDIMIVSHALADPKSKFFFTNDTKLIGNSVINKYDVALNNDGKREMNLEIRDGFRARA